MTNHRQLSSEKTPEVLEGEVVVGGPARSKAPIVSSFFQYKKTTTTSDGAATSVTETTFVLDKKDVAALAQAAKRVIIFIIGSAPYAVYAFEAALKYLS